MTNSLKGKVALVTGGSRGIGAASARALADEGANVAISYVASPDKAEALVRDLRAKGVQAQAFKADQVDWLVDLGSANGSYVNDVALTAPRVLRAGDRVQFGRCVLQFDQDEPVVRPTLRPAADGKTHVSHTTTVPLRSEPVTLLVADLQGFTRLSSQLTAEQVADLLREWYGDCNAILNHYGASIDKFIGDCVFAYWHGVDTETRGRALHAAQALRAVELESTSPMRVLLRQVKNVVLDCRIGSMSGSMS